MSTEETSGNGSDGVECPSCDRTFKNRLALGTHHGRTHGESLKHYERRTNDDLNVECPYCDLKYATRDGLGQHMAVKHDETLQEYECSGDYPCPYDGCDSAFDTERGLSLHHVQKHGMSIAGEVIECAYCGETERVDKDLARASEQHFCDYSCHGAYKSEYNIGDANPNWRGGPDQRTCSHCGASVTVFQKSRKKLERVFCSRECGWVGAKRQTGSDHHWYTGGKPTYGPGWTPRTKEKVRERQNRRCLGCGLPEEENPTRLEVHHVVKAKRIDDPEERNGVDNLVALCCDCHLVWESMSPLRPQTAYTEQFFCDD